MHHDWRLLLALIPLGALLWWAVQSRRAISAMQQHNQQTRAALERRLVALRAWLHEEDEQ